MESEKSMSKEFIEKIQKRVVNLLKTLSNDLRVAAKDRCSEVARLVGCWILDEYPECGVQVCKGILSDGSAHDLLVVESGKTLFLVDPTIWQILQESSDIFVGSVHNVLEVINFLQKKYGGIWKISEIMRKCDESYQQELLTVIKNNRKEI